MTQKATIAQVKIGNICIDGIMLPNGNYGVSVPQIADLIGASKNTLSRDLKRLLGEGFSPSKTSVSSIKQKINIVLLSDFMVILNKIAFSGNKEAQALLLALAEESIERRFNHAFGQKCTEDEYNELLKVRIKRLMARHDYTDILMNRHVDLYGVKPEPKDYKEWTIKVNKALFNQAHFNCDRNTMTKEQQELITDFELTAKRFALKDNKLTPAELIFKALETF